MNTMNEKQPEVVAPKQKKAYQSPELVNYGAVADLTNTSPSGMGGDNSGPANSKS